MNAAIEKLKASPLDHLGERVITLGMMDEAHGRPEGTAGRAFRKHREKLAEGRHYFTVGTNDVLRRSLGFPEQGGGRDAVLLTERGYLVLVKTFRDDLAWQVQEEIVEGYFRARAQPSDPAMEAVRQLSSVISGFVQGMLSAHDRQIRILAAVTEERFSEQDRKIKQLRAGARVQATGRRGGTERKVRHRAPKGLAPVTPLLPLTPGGER
jgi:hypothetical protein